MIFAKPEMLGLLAVTLPLLAWFLIWAWRKKQKLIGQFVQSRLLAHLTVGVSARRQKLRLVLLAAAVALLLLALARPLLGFAWEEVKQRGLDIVVVLDTSRSMLAADVAPSRLARAKLAALDLMQAARRDRLGLVVFAGTAFLQCPLTLDDTAFAQSVNAVEVGTIPLGGTALAAAIRTAVATFKESGENHRVIVLFTDGEDHEEGVIEAAERAAEAGVRIYPVGVGTFEGDRISVRDDSGRTAYVTDESGQPVISKLNGSILQQIAEKTRGDYIALRGANVMELLYNARLAGLPRGETGSRIFRQYHERFQWPLGLAILLLLVEIFLPERRRVPRTEAIVAASHAELRKVVAVAALLLVSLGAHASSGRAQRDYEKGRFKEAQQEYERLAEQHPDDPRYRYNAGTAAYRAGRYDQATNELNAAILSQDPQLLERAYYNLGNTHFRLAQQATNLAEALASLDSARASFESVGKLNPQDADARHNLLLSHLTAGDLAAGVGQQLGDSPQAIPPWQQAVRSYDAAMGLNPAEPGLKEKQENAHRILEELLKRYPPPPKPDQQPPEDNKDQKDQNQDQPQQGSQSQDQKPDQDQQSSSGQQQQQEADASPQRQPGQESSQGSESPPEPKPSQDSKPQPGKRGDERSRGTPSPAGGTNAPSAEAGAALGQVKPGQMTPDQAARVLDAARIEERPMVFSTQRDAKAQPRPMRDW